MRARLPDAFDVDARFAIRYSPRGDLRVCPKHGIHDLDINHAVEHALAGGEQDDGKVLYLGPDRAGNMLEVVSVLRDEGTELVIHAMAMRKRYESFLSDPGDPDG